MSSSPLAGASTLVRRRLIIATKTPDRIIGQLMTPMLWVLIVAPALDTAFGSAPGSDLDYFSYVAVAQVAFLLPFTAMFSGLNSLVDRTTVLREFLAAPIPRAAIPLASAASVLVLALVQAGVILGLAVARGADFTFTAGGMAWFLAASCLLTLSVYGLAEILTWVVGRQEAYGPLIPAVGVTPWLLAGTLFPLHLLPAGIEQASYALPWTHALALMRYGLLGGRHSGLHDIWHMGSNGGMATLSLVALVLFAGASMALAVRTFNRRTLT